MKLDRIINNYFTSKPIVVDGYKYTFKKLDGENSESDYNFYVNIELPKKGQSYIREILFEKVDGVIRNLWKYLGVDFEVGIRDLTVDGLEPIDVFISPENVNEIINSVQNKIKHAKIGKLEFDIELYPDRKLFYRLDYPNIDFYFRADIRKLKWNGNPVIIKDNMYDETAGVINSQLSDSDNFRQIIDDIIYDSVALDTDINSSRDLTISGLYYITRIDGIEVFPRHHHMEIDPEEMFI